MVTMVKLKDYGLDKFSRDALRRALTLDERIQELIATGVFYGEVNFSKINHKNISLSRYTTIVSGFIGIKITKVCLFNDSIEVHYDIMPFIMDDYYDQINKGKYKIVPRALIPNDTDLEDKLKFVTFDIEF